MALPKFTTRVQYVWVRPEQTAPGITLMGYSSPVLGSIGALPAGALQLDFTFTLPYTLYLAEISFVKGEI